MIRKRLTDLTRTTSDESAEESDNDEETKTKNRKDPIAAPPESAHTTLESIDHPSRPTIKAESPQNDTKVSPRHTSALGGAPITGTKLPSKRKLAVNEAFRDDQDEDNTNTFQKKSKLTVILDQPPPTATTTTTVSPPVKEEPINRTKPAVTIIPPANINSVQIQEEKRQAVRKLIESIPTKKEDLFTFPLDWSMLDSNLMEKRIKPWVTKKDC